jgi:GNAT superfamily N-acetyltransferase
LVKKVAVASLSPPIPISEDIDVSQFDCGEPNLNSWLKSRALKNESRFSRTYVVCDGTKAAAYYCISAGSVERIAAPSKVRRNAPDAIPVAIIGRLAVCKAFAGRGLGASILADALSRIAMASKSIGIGAVLVQAKDDSAKRFYLACAEFVEFPNDSRTLFLPIETIVAALT